MVAWRVLDTPTLVLDTPGRVLDTPWQVLEIPGLVGAYVQGLFV